MTVSMWIATLAWLLLSCGLIHRHSVSKHLPRVLSGITIDIVLVGYLAITRDAIQTALQFDLSVLNQLHILCSTIACILYFPLLYVGFRLLKKRSSQILRRIHKRLAFTAYLFRTAGFIFMFSML